MKLKYFTLLFLTSCQTTKVRTENNAVCDSTRNPAAQTCPSLFTPSKPLLEQYRPDPTKQMVSKEDQIQNRAPSQALLQTVFTQLSNYGVNMWDIIRAVEVGYSGFNYNQERNDIPKYYGALLARRRAEGESTARILTELGYREQNGYLMPPRNIPGLYEKLYQRLLLSAKEAGIPREDIIFPCMLFERKLTEDDRAWSEQIFVRPGIDKLPPKNQDWKLVTSEIELNNELFTRMISEKKMLLAPGMFFHDLNHFVDLIERPHYMIAFRKFMIQKKKFLDQIKSMTSEQINSDYGMAIRSIAKVDEVLNEFSIFPNNKKQNQINKFLLSNSEEKLKSFQETLHLYEALPINVSLNKARQLLAIKESIFARHGGGIRDFYIERYYNNDYTAKSFGEILAGKSLYVERSGDGGMYMDYRSAYILHEPTGMLQRLSVLVELAETPQTSRKVSSYMPAELLLDEGLKKALDIQLAEIDHRIRSSQFYRITPEKILTDLRLLMEPYGWKQYIESDTFNYYSTFLPGTYQWHNFVDIKPHQ